MGGEGVYDLFVSRTHRFRDTLEIMLLALLLPVQVAAPIAVMVSVTVALIVIVQDWRKVYARSAARLVLPTMLGIPLGLILLRVVAEP